MVGGEWDGVGLKWGAQGRGGVRIAAGIGRRQGPGARGGAPGTRGPPSACKTGTDAGKAPTRVHGGWGLAAPAVEYAPCVNPDPATPRRVVLLLHEGHGAAHIDLLMERDDGPLVTFRAPLGVKLALAAGDAAAFEAERLADHRRVYLEYEGPVSNNRGTVRRLATHTLLAFAALPNALHLTVGASATPASAPSAAATDWTARPNPQGLWRFEGRGRLEESGMGFGMGAADAGVPR